MSAVTPDWLSEVVAGYDKDDKAKQLLTELAIAPKAMPNFQLRAGVLRYKDRLWLGHDVSLQQKVSQAFHSSPLGGHSRFPVTYHRIKKLFYWPGLKSTVRLFVQSCVVCQQAKPDRCKCPGLLQPLPIPSQAWKIVSMDFVEGLPRSRHVNCIIVVVHKFSEYSHFIPLLHSFQPRKWR